MKLSLFRQLTILIFLAMMTSCSIHSIPDNEMPELGFPVEEANRDLELYSFTGYDNSYKNSDILTLLIKVKSDYPIHFPMDYGTRIFIYKEEQWLEIQNNMVYPTVEQYGGENILPPSEDNILKEDLYAAAPYYSDLEKATPARLIVVGNIIENEKTTDELSVGYFDFVLYP